MTVQEVIELARRGELRGVSVAPTPDGDDTGVILGYINLGLIELYKRFPLKIEEQLITLVDGQVFYTLNSDVIRIIAAYDEVEADSDEYYHEIPVNEEENPYSVNVVNWNQVQVPISVNGSYISLIYTASPALLTETDLSNSIPIPPQMVEALLHYIGYRGHSSVNGEIQAENSTHYTRFEASCQRLQNMGLYTADDVEIRNRIVKRGFA